MATPGGRGDPGRQAGRQDLARRRGRGPPRPAAQDQGRPRRHARPVRHRPAAGAGGTRRTAAALPDGRCPRPTGWRRGWGGPRTPATARACWSTPGRVPADPRIPEGEQLQRPPAYSAVKVDGERLYAKARRGEAVEGEPRPVTVHRAELVALEGEPATFDIECSSGTYVRQLVAALGDAYCTELRAHRHRPVLAWTTPTRPRCWARPRALAFMPERRARRRAGAAGLARREADPRRGRAGAVARAADARRRAGGRRRATGPAAGARRSVRAVKVTSLRDIPELPPGEARRARWPSAPSTACTWATAR